MARKTKARLTFYPITYRLIVEEDDVEVRGNAIASGDDAADKVIEDEILARLENGDVWAWARVEVRAECAGFVGRDFLGACTYRDEAEFRKDAYYTDMCELALDDLRDTLKRAMTDGRKAHAVLAQLNRREFLAALEARASKQGK